MQGAYDAKCTCTYPESRKRTFCCSIEANLATANYQAARSYAEHFMDTEENQHPVAIQVLEEGVEDTLQSDSLYIRVFINLI